MITSLAWVPKGAPRKVPVRFELSPEEYARIKALAQLEEDAIKDEDSHDFEVSGSNIRAEEVIDNDKDDADEDVDDDALPSELRMDAYDDDDEDEGEIDDFDEYAVVEQGDAALAFEHERDMDDEDAEDDEVRETDSMLVVAMTEDDYSHLEVQLFTEDGTIFVHHDISLPDFPLCLAWMDCPPFRAQGGQVAVGNYIAVGTFNPAIEIWNLDVLDPLEPTAVLGGVVDEKQIKKKKKKKGTQAEDEDDLRIGSHRDAVMTLSWNKAYRQALASGSADTTVKLWDVTTQECSHTFTHHSDKVQAVQWHGSDAWLLATAAFDKTVVLLDCRTGSPLGGTDARFSIPADVEALAWDPHSSPHLYCALEDGQVVCFDIRVLGSGVDNMAAELFRFQAHSTTVSGMSFSPTIPGMLATASVDKIVKMWDVSVAYHGNSSAVKKKKKKSASVIEPKMVAYKSMNVGKLFALQFSDSAYVLAAGGDKGMVAIWESDEQEAVARYFASREAPGAAAGGCDVTLEDAQGASKIYKAATAVGEKGEEDAAATGGRGDDSWMDIEEDSRTTEVKKKKKNKKSKSQIVY